MTLHSHDEEFRMREKALDETLAGTFPSTHPPASAGLADDEARITIRRKSPEDVGVRDIFVSIDGEQVAILEPNETFTLGVRPGRHRVRAHNTLFWKTQDLVLRPGEHARFTAINKAGFGALGFMTFLGAAPLYVTFERDK